MEEVYVVKVKTRPEPSKLYPSERRYSAVTVGGLGLVHALLAVTSLLLAALGIAAEGVAASYGAGIALGLAGCGAAVVGVLAWRRWYVDNNIRYFLVTSSVSGLAAIVCIVLTSVAIATMQEDLALHRLSLRYNTALPMRLPLVAPEPGYQDAAYDDDDDDADNYDNNNNNNTDLIHKFILAFENRKNRSDLQTLPPNETFRLRLDDDFDRAVAENDEKTRTVPSVVPIQTVDDEMKVFEHGRKETVEDEDDVIDGDYRTLPSTSTTTTTTTTTVGSTEDVLPIVVNNNNNYNYNNGRIVGEDAGKEVRNVLSVNILIASFLELAWSLLSMRIAWKGMTNDYPDDDAIIGAEKTKRKTETGYLPKFMKSDKTKEREGADAGAGVRRPDILSNHQSQQRHNNVRRKMNVAVVSDDVEQYLPQQESTTEYHERVRRFLASNNENSC